MRRSAVALRHVPFEDLGLLAPILQREGWEVTLRDVATEDLVHDSIADAGLLIVLGGPIGACETAAYPFLTSELALIEYRLARDLPVLGICLGSQLMAKALGSRVFAGPVKEIGWGGVELTGEGAASCLAPLRQDDAVVLHWHGDSFRPAARRAASGIEPALREPGIRLSAQRPGAAVSPRGRPAPAGAMVCRPCRRTRRGKTVSRRIAGGAPHGLPMAVPGSRTGFSPAGSREIGTPKGPSPLPRSVSDEAIHRAVTPGRASARTRNRRFRARCFASPRNDSAADCFVGSRSSQQ